MPFQHIFRIQNQTSGSGVIAQKRWQNLLKMREMLSRIAPSGKDFASMATKLAGMMVLALIRLDMFQNKYIADILV